MNKDYLKKVLAYNRIEGKNLFILPSLSSWFVLSDKQAIALKLFLELNDENEILKNLSLELNISHDDAESVYKATLKVLKTGKVYPISEVTILAPDPGGYPTNIQLALTHRCNLRCKHCYISAGEKDFDDWA